MASRPAAASLPGLRRVDWVRITVGADGPHAEVVGLAHRHPATVPVPVGTAARLAREGIPLVVRDERG